MDRAWENLLIRSFGSFSFAATLLHLGARFHGAGGATVWLVLVPAAVAAVAANWGLARLNVKRPALWVTTVLLGLAPLVIPAFPQEGLGSFAQLTLYALELFAALTLGFGAYLLWTRRDAAPSGAE